MKEIRRRHRANYLISIIMNTICVFLVMIGIGGADSSKMSTCVFCILTGFIFGTIGMQFDRKAREAKQDMIRYIHRYPYVLAENQKLMRYIA